MRKILTVLIVVSLSMAGISQTLIIDGYTFQSGNRGFIAKAKITVKDGEETLKTTISDNEGHFYVTVPERESYTLHITSELYEELILKIDSKTKSAENKLFVKAKLRRLPGYLFEITMANERSSEDSIVDAITDTRIDVFNNTTFEEVFVLDDYPEPEFSLPLFKGNHYTVLLRKEGYITKRLEAFVDVEGCILCFEGLGSVRPGVTENLSQNNQIGVLLANVTLEKAFSGKTIVLKDLYYDFGKAFLKPGAKKELIKLTQMMKDNPGIKVELGAHTDSRGDSDKNRTLSQRRAANAVKYLVGKGIDEERIISYGYGESQLRNECADGVKCNEEKHAYNRRTELKIIDVVKSDERVKSLKQMKMMEKAEKEMEGLAFGGQVDVEDDREKIEEEEEEEEMNEDPVFDEINEEANTTEEEEIIEVSSEIIVESNVSSEVTENQNIVYKIVIKESSEPVAMDGDLYKTHNDLVEVKSGAIYSYLIGTFDNLAEVQKFYKETVQLVYPKSKIVKYQDGKIL